MNHKKPRNTTLLRLRPKKSCRASELTHFFAIEQNLSYEEHMQETITLARAVSPPAACRRRLSPGSLAWKQLKFFAPRVWFWQGMILAALCAVLFQWYGADAFHSMESLGWSARSLPKFLGLCGGVTAASAIPLLLRSTRYQMLELEQSTYFSVRGNLAAQLLFICIGDLGMLAVLALCAESLRVAGGTILLSLVIPYLTASVSCVMLWVRTPSSFFRNAGAVLCLASSYLAGALAEQGRQLAPRVQITFWVMYAAACIYVLYHECTAVTLREIWNTAK